VKRRAFIALIGGAAAAWPLAARAQHKIPTIGFLGALSQSAQSPWTAAFVQRMREHGWIEGRTIAIEYRWAEGRGERFAEIATEFVRLKVDVIVTAGTDAVIAAKKVTSVVPIVFGTAGDPVANGLVASLARPGGNVTGLSNQSAYIAGKRLGLLYEILPNLRRLAIMANVGSSIGVLEMREVAVAARTAMNALNGGADALYVVTEPLVNTNRIQINSLALRARLPTLHGWPNVLWRKHSGPIPARCRLCRQDSAWRQAG
jgi:putative tryptophan/tyrosine transport system substrate-binding protein